MLSCLNASSFMKLTWDSVVGIQALSDIIRGLLFTLYAQKPTFNDHKSYSPRKTFYHQNINKQKKRRKL